MNPWQEYSTNYCNLFVNNPNLTMRAGSVKINFIQNKAGPVNAQQLPIITCFTPPVQTQRKGYSQ